MRLKLAAFLIALTLSTLACGVALTPPAPTSNPAPTRAAVSKAPPSKSVLVADYDPSRDPVKDVQAAIPMAQSAHKRIMLEVGGEWCVWCHIMDAFYDAHPDLLKLRDDHYILVKVNMSQENENKAFLGQYPEIPGYPHVFILDSDGKLVQSQNTSELEEGESYNLGKFTAFLQKWAIQ